MHLHPAVVRTWPPALCFCASNDIAVFEGLCPSCLCNRAAVRIKEVTQSTGKGSGTGPPRPCLQMRWPFRIAAAGLARTDLAPTPSYNGQDAWGSAAWQMGKPVRNAFTSAAAGWRHVWFPLPAHQANWRYLQAASGPLKSTMKRHLVSVEHPSHVYVGRSKQHHLALRLALVGVVTPRQQPGWAVPPPVAAAAAVGAGLSSLSAVPQQDDCTQAP